MELGEIIRQFSFPHLRGAYIDLAHQVYDFPKWLIEVSDSMENTHRKRWEAFSNLKPIFESNSTEMYLDGIQKCLGEINEARARQILDDVNKSGISIDADEHLHLALVFAFIPKDGLEDMAIANNISIPSDTGSGVGSFMRGASRDKGKWALIKKLTSELIVIESNVEEGIHSFCPDCKEDNPEGADHCISCGRELPQITCSKCETANPPQAKFCMGCGEER